MSAVIKQESQLPQATSLLEAISRAAADPAMDIEKMERLFAMHERMVARQAENAFNAALSKAQAEITTVARNKFNDHTRSKYADLDAIVNAIAPVYTAHGFAVSFNTEDVSKPDMIKVVATLSHSDGHSRRYQYDAPIDGAGAKGNVNKTAIQASGSTNSYARRYLICMIFNVTTADDVDGNRDKRITPTAGVKENITPERQKQIEEMAQKVRDWIEKGSIADAVVESENYVFEAEERIYFHTLFDPKERAALKKEAKRQRDESTAKAQAAAIEKHNANEAAVISESQHKRLEARINEHGVNRESLKNYVKETYGKDHFTELTKAEYDDVDGMIETLSLASQA